MIEGPHTREARKARQMTDREWRRLLEDLDNVKPHDPQITQKLAAVAAAAKAGRLVPLLTASLRSNDSVVVAVVERLTIIAIADAGARIMERCAGACDAKQAEAN